MPLPHNLRAPVDMMKPRPVGISDFSGFMFYLDEMVWVFQYAGNRLVNRRMLVGPTEVDLPAPFLQTYVFGPEPAPLPDARPWHYAQQSQGGTPAPSISEILGDDE